MLPLSVCWGSAISRAFAKRLLLRASRRISAGFGHESSLGEDCITFTICGNAFLHSMVRTIVGTLVEVGMHRREPEWIDEVLAACSRQAAGPTAPACGLCFMDVEYDDGALTVAG